MNISQMLLAKTLAIGAKLFDRTLPPSPPPQPNIATSTSQAEQLLTDRACRYDNSATVLLHAQVCAETAAIFEAQGKTDDAALHRTAAAAHFHSSALGADSMMAAHVHGRNGQMMHKVRGGLLPVMVMLTCNGAAGLKLYNPAFLKAGRLSEAHSSYAMALRIKLAKVLPLLPGRACSALFHLIQFAVR